MRRRVVLVVVGLLLAACNGGAADETTSVPATTVAPVATSTSTATTTPPAPDLAPYRDRSLPVEDRIDDLLGRMTLDEKIGQMTLVEKGSIRPSQVTERFVGAVLSGGGGAPRPNNPGAWVEMTAEFQDAALATRLGIPLLYGADAIHGHNNLRDAVIFPHNVGLGAARSPELVARIARITAVEAAATGVFWNYAPVLAVPRDIRWGRTYEAYGEDPQLVTELGTAFIRGLQGAGLDAPDTMLATPKHFVGDGATEWGSSTTGSYQIDQGDARITEDELREVHLAPYVAAVDAGALSVMASFSSWQGTKLHASEELLTGVLKDELGFEGFVVSDWAAIDQIDPGDYYGSVVSAINAGVDMNMVPTNYELFITALRGAVNQGDVTQERVDDAVRRILRAKFALGLFEQPYPDPALLDAIGSDEHRAVAADAVEQSLVLVVNDGETLPIAASTIFVAGAAANDVGRQSGGWTISWQGDTGSVTAGTTILDGIEAQAGDGAAVLYDRFGRFDGDGVPARADVGIVVVGERPYAEGAGDDPDLRLDDREIEIVRDVTERVDALVVVLVSGRPLLLDEILPAADVVVAAWLPGSEGAAVAGPLFGETSFTGRLPYAWPRAAEQLPFAYPTSAGGVCSTPLLPFGHGLAASEASRPELVECGAGAG